MPISFAHICDRDSASDEYTRMKEIGILNQDLKPMPYSDLIAIPVTQGELELEFEVVERQNPHIELQSILENPPKRWEKLETW